LPGLGSLTTIWTMIKSSMATFAGAVKRSSRWRRANIAIALGAAAVGASVLVPASPAFASDHGCQSYAWGEVCIYITGGGTHVDSITGEVYDIQPPGCHPNVHVELVFPSGQKIANSGTGCLASGSPFSVTWSPNATEPTGNYGAILWIGPAPYDPFLEAYAPVS
jgi:hypothetical protein